MFARGERDGQRALDGPDFAGERQFADDPVVVEVPRRAAARDAARMPSAMGRSKLGPSFFTSAGARLMVTRP